MKRLTLPLTLLLLPSALLLIAAAPVTRPAERREAGRDSIDPRARLDALGEKSRKSRDACRAFEEQVKSLSRDRNASARFPEKNLAMQALQCVEKYPGTPEASAQGYQLLMELPASALQGDHDWVARAYNHLLPACAPAELHGLIKRLLASVGSLELAAGEEQRIRKSLCSTLERETRRPEPLVPLSKQIAIFRELLSSPLGSSPRDQTHAAREVSEELERVRLELATRITDGTGATDAGFADNVLHELRETDPVRVRFRKLLLATSGGCWFDQEK